jgi:hypothetical protein
MGLIYLYLLSLYAHNINIDISANLGYWRLLGKANLNWELYGWLAGCLMVTSVLMQIKLELRHFHWTIPRTVYTLPM